MSTERLDKILSGQNIATRSESKKIALKGLLTVNGKITKRSDIKVDPEKDEIIIKGEKLIYKKHLYIMMNKPAGILSASRDKNAQTVIDLLPAPMRREGLFPAGRLDRDTTGFILITDDGELSHRMLSPKKHIFKLYEAECDKTLTDEDVKRFAEGISSGEDDFLPAAMRITGEKTALVEICEGKFHQIKRMFHAVGAEVLKLKRLRIGALYLDDTLNEGGFRELTAAEIMKLTDNEFRELEICEQ